MQALSSGSTQYQATEQDALGYTHACVVSAIILISSCGLAAWYLREGVPLLLLPAGEVPHPVILGFLFLAVLLALPRWMINFHELLHIHSEHQVHPFIRLMGVSPVPLSIVSLSYGQIRTLHFAHHAAPTTETDPDAYHIRGSWLQTVFSAFSAPEQSTLRWMARYGVSQQLAVDCGIKLLILAALVWLGGTTFLWFWLCLRLVYGCGDIAFFRMVHHHQGNYGTFPLSLPAGLIALGEQIFGKTVIQATIHHDIHHKDPRISVQFLAAAQVDGAADLLRRSGRQAIPIASSQRQAPSEEG